VSATELLSSVLELPNAAHGGEVFFVLPESQRVRPLRYQLKGPQDLDITIEHSTVEAAGLLEGDYELVGMYEGGIKREVIKVSVRPGESVVRQLPVAMVGGAIGQLGPVMCSVADKLRLYGPPESGKVPLLTELDVRPDCSATVSGLRPGAYMLAARGQQGDVSSKQLTVAAGVLSRTEFQEPVAAMSGIVSLVDRPLSNTPLEIASSLGPGDLRWAVRTDSAGAYRVALMSTGPHTMSLQPAGTSLGPQQTVDIRAGDQIVDWRVSGAAFQIEFEGWDGTPATITMTRQPSSLASQAMTNVQVSRSSDLPLKVEVVPFGEYRFSARTSSGLSTTTHLSNLSAEKPYERVRLDFRRRSGTLLVSDESGTNLTNATVGAAGRRIEPFGAGLFDLTGVSAGQEIQVSAAGYARTCVVRNESDAPLTVRLQRGQTVFVAKQDADLLTGRLFGVPGSSCAVNMFSFQPRPNGDRFEISSFPLGQGMTVVVGERSLRVEVGPDGYLRIR